MSDRGPAPGREVTPGVTVSVSRPGASVSGPRGVTEPGSNIDMTHYVSQTRLTAEISDSELNSTDQNNSEKTDCYPSDNIQSETQKRCPDSPGTPPQPQQQQASQQQTETQQQTEPDNIVSLNERK